MSRMLAIVGIGLLLSPATAVGQELNGDQVQGAVAAATPVDLMAADGVGGTTNSCSAIYDSKARPPMIVAAYAAGGLGRVEMMTYRALVGTTYGIVERLFELTEHDYAFGGRRCTAEIVDLAPPSGHDVTLSKVIKVSFDGSDWYFRWNGSALVNVGALAAPEYPTLPAGSAIVQSSVVDVLRTGAMQIVGNADQADPLADKYAAPPALLYHFDGTQYVQAAKYEMLSILSDFAGLANPRDVPVAISTAVNPYTLTVINGTRKGTDRVARARILLDGNEVIKPTELTQHEVTVVRTVSITKDSRFSIGADANGDAVLYVILQKP